MAQPPKSKFNMFESFNLNLFFFCLQDELNGKISTLEFELTTQTKKVDELEATKDSLSKGFVEMYKMCSSVADISSSFMNAHANIAAKHSGKNF